MSDVSPYGITQNANAELVTANELVGERTDQTVRENALHGSAAMFSTAPYLPDKIDGRPRGRVGCCKGKNDTCMAFVIHGTDLCVFHTPGQVRPDRIGEPE